MKFALGLAFLAAGCLPAAGAAPDVASRGDVVVKVVDGDTIETRESGRVRIVGLNAPETTKGVVECMGGEAADRLAALVPPGADVMVEPGEVAATDRYGRSLGYVFADGTQVGLVLVGEGLARSAYYGDNIEHFAAFRAAERSAANAGLGGWSACGWQLPAVPPGPLASCAEAEALGVAPLWRDEPGFAAGLDRDGDGWACT